MGVISALREGKHAHDVAEPRSEACLNCGTPLNGPFCSQCGQRDVPPYPSVRELVVDAFWELSGWDGRFASTLRTLVTKPGRLTVDFLEGRRARSISPLRLYLMASLVYFIVAAAVPNTRRSEPSVTLDARRPSTTSVTKAEQVGNAARDALSKQEALSPEARDSIMKAIAKAPPSMRPLFQRIILDPKGFKRSIIEAMPKMLFALLPIFAAIVSLFYRRRKYPEHLYFAIHLHAFVFVVLTVAALFKFTRITALSGVVSTLALLSIPIYTTLAFRQTYGGSVGKTIVKEVGIWAIYSMVSAVAFVATLFAISRIG
jgi:hypothetical protein